MFKYKWGHCHDCPTDIVRLLVVKAGYCQEHNEKRKKEKKACRVVGLVNRAEKRKSTKFLKKQLREVFHKFIRVRDTPGGYGICIDCGGPVSRAKVQAGHYYAAGTHEALRFDERNVNGTHAMCNYRQGSTQSPGYTRGIVAKYGASIINILESRMRNTVKMSAFEYEILIKEYSRKLNEILNKH